MQGLLKFKLLKSLVLLLALGCVSLGWAKTSNQPDVRLIVDISGSMKRTDPNNLRIPATNLLIDLLPENSQAGIWTFGAYVNMLVKHGEVTSNWRANARKEANKINSVALFTDIENAIERASWDIKSTQVETDRHLILLSDGMVDISEAGTAKAREAENEKSRDFLLRQKANELAEAGFTVHTLALSDEADLDLMATLAQRTGGLHAVAYKSEDLMPLLLQIINRLAPSDEVALENNKFLIDPSIDEFTLLVFHAENAQASLVSPNGQHYSAASSADNQRWHSTGSYTLVTVNKPEAGNWHLQTPEHPDNRVTVVSNVRLEANKLPPTLFRGYPVEIDAWLTENDQPITKQDFLQLLNLKTKLSKNGNNLLEEALALEAASHKFTATLDELPELGEQSLQIEVDGQTFNRKLSQSINVQDVVAASLQLPEDGSSPRIILRAQDPNLNPHTLSFLITANGSNLTAEYRGDGEWKVDLSQLSRSQEQEIAILVKIDDAAANTIDLPKLYLAALPQAIKEEPVEVAEPEAITEQEAQPETPQETPPVEEVVEEQPVEVEKIPDELAQPNEPKLSWWDNLVKQAKQILGGNLDPIDSWEDSRMPVVYSALAFANLLVFLIAVIMYRRFLKKRAANEKTPQASKKKTKKKKASAITEDEEQELPALDELDDEEDLK